MLKGGKSDGGVCRKVTRSWYEWTQLETFRSLCTHWLLLPIAAWCLITSCHDSIEPETVLIHSSLPVSDSVAIPNLHLAISVTTKEVTLLLSGAREARYFEVDRSFDTTLGAWTLIATPDPSHCDNCGLIIPNISLGVIDSSETVYIRARAVYETVVSRWCTSLKLTGN